MADILVGSVAVEVVPDAREFVPRLKSDLTDIPDVGVKVTLDDLDAVTRLDSLKTSLDELGHKSVTASVRVDTAGATADLAKFRAEMDAATTGGGTSGAGVFSSISSGAQQAAAAISPMVAAILTIGPALVPIGAAAAAGLGGIATMAAAGTAGLGVLYLGLSDVVKAVEAVSKAQESSAADAAAQAQAEVAATQQVKSAQMALADANRRAADDQITDQESLAAASQQVTQARITGAQQVAAAEQSLGTAERTLTDAVYTETEAQQALIQARQTAQRQLESYRQQLADGALQQQQDLLNIQQAQQNLSAVLGNPLSSQLQRDQAQLSLDQAKQALVDQRQNYQNLQQDAAAAAKAGVDGAANVVAAQHQLAQAHQGVLDAQQGFAAAAKAVQTAQTNAAAAVAAALQHQGDVERQVANQQIADQEAIVRAQDQVATALAAQTKAYESVSAAQKAAASALAGLSPAGRDLVTFITGTLMPAFSGLKTAAEEGLLPGVQSLLTDLLPLLPGLTTMVGSLARTMGDLFAGIGKELTDPFWTQFFGWLASTAGPTLQTMATVAGNVAEGFAGLIEALGPVTQTIGDAFAGMSKGFADFATNTKPGSPLEQFISFTQKSLPVVGSTLEAIGKAFGHIAVAAAPVGLVVLDVLREFARVVSAIPAPLLTVAIGVTSVVVPALLGLSVAFKVAESDAVEWFATQTAGLATWVAETAASVAETTGLWVLYAAEWLASTATSVATFLAEHTVMAATFIAQNTAMVASATAAFIAENAATLGIVAAIGAIVGAIVYVATHWSEVWGDIKAVAEDAWHFLDHIFNDGIMGDILSFTFPLIGLATHWSDVWNGIQTVVQDVWNVLKPIFHDIGDGVSAITGAVQKADSLAHTGGKLNPLNWGTGTSNHPGGFAFVADAGAPEIVTLPNGQTFVAPTKMLLDLPIGTKVMSTADTARILSGHADWQGRSIDSSALSAWHGPGTTLTAPPPLAASLSGSQPGQRSGVRDITVIAQTNADPFEIGREIAWLPRSGQI